MEMIVPTWGHSLSGCHRHWASAVGWLSCSPACRTYGSDDRPTSIGPSPRWCASRAPRDFRNRKVMASIARSTAAHAAREYGEAFAGSEWRIEGPQRNRCFFRLHPAPSRPKLARFNALLV